MDEYKGYTITEFTYGNCFDGCDTRCSHTRTTYFADREGNRQLWSDSLRGLKAKITNATK